MSSSETNGEFDEDTYSTIFTALKHPIRRRILRMLSERSLSFTEIQNALAVNSAQLSFHIRGLKELITQTKNRKYSLSIFGKAATSLMGEVEETMGTSTRMIEFKWALIAVLAVVFLPFVKIEPGPIAGSGWTFYMGFPVALLILIWRYFKKK